MNQVVNKKAVDFLVLHAFNVWVKFPINKIEFLANNAKLCKIKQISRMEYLKG